MSKSESASLVAAAHAFARALDNAIYDKSVESEQDLLFLYDADVIIQTVLGFTSWDRTLPVPDITELLYVVRALFSVGYLPRAFLLRPHLVEFERFIKRVPAPRGLEAGVRMRNFQFLAKQWGLDQHDLRLKEYSSDLGALQSVIRSDGFEIFVKVELCYGGLAYDRLLRVAQHCALRSHMLAYEPMRPGDAFAHQVAHEISYGKYRSTKGINNLVDGYAISELAAHVAKAAPVRFYTETRPLRRLAYDWRLRDQSGRSVIRDAAYFVMRSSFPAVGFPHLNVNVREPRDPSERTLDDLVALNKRFQVLFTNTRGTIDNPELERAIRNEQAGGPGETLADLIRDFYALKFLKNVFLSRWRVPEGMGSLLPYLSSFFHDQQRIAEVREALGRRLIAITKALSEEIGQLAKWQVDAQQFRQALQQRREHFSGVTPDPWRDLGLGRWGLDVFLPERTQNELLRWVADVADDDASVDRLASDLALQVSPDGYASWEDFALAQCQLWTLKLYDRLVAEWEENRNRFTNPEMGVLQILYLVARIKSVTAGFRNGDGEAARIRSLVTEAEVRLSQLRLGSDDLSGVGQMGIAHVAYWAWQRLRDIGEPQFAEQMLEKSFDAADRARRDFQEGSLAWAFAINHCVYIGTVGRIRKADTEELRKRLIHVNPKHEHYRFADTRARRYTEELRDLVEQYDDVTRIASERHLKGVHNDLCGLVKEAQHLLNKFRPFFGDEEVERHWAELQDYKTILKCRTSRNKPKNRR